MKTIDIHCHLQHERFDKDREEVIKEAKEKMFFLIVSGARPDWNRAAVKLAEEHPKFIYATIGLHPCDAIKLSETEFDAELEFISQSREKIVGIGEIGLDFHWVKEKRKQNFEVERLKRLLELSKTLKLPVVIHSWDAEAEVIKILNDNDIKNAVMHCFSGKKESLLEALKCGYFISFSTQICSSKNHKKLARDTPLDKILIETDAPWLDPNKGRNVPWNTTVVAEKIAEIKKIKPEGVIGQALENAKRVFGI